VTILFPFRPPSNPFDTENIEEEKKLDEYQFSSEQVDLNLHELTSVPLRQILMSQKKRHSATRTNDAHFPIHKDQLQIHENSMNAEFARILERRTSRHLSLKKRMSKLQMGPRRNSQMSSGSKFEFKISPILPLEVKDQS
jgi:hypothetical protein